MMSDREMPASYNNASLGGIGGAESSSSLLMNSSSSGAVAAPSSPPSSTSEEAPSKTPARNLPWQRHFKLRIAPLCLEVIKDSSGYLTFERALNIAVLKDIPKVVVADCNRPPSNLPYNVITLAIAAGGPTSGSSSAASMMEQVDSGLYLVREISSIPLLPENNTLVINERLFMDKTREMYKSKGWGTANWRFWLALEDVDVMQKRRNKRAILDKRRMAKSLDSGARGSIDESESLPSAPELDHPSGIVIHHNDTAAQLAQHRKKAKEVQPEFAPYFQPPPSQLFQPLPQLSQLSISPAPTPYLTSPHLPPTVSPASMIQRHMQASLLSMPPMPPSFQNRAFGFPPMIPPPPQPYGAPFGQMLSGYPGSAGMMGAPQRSNSSSASAMKPGESTSSSTSGGGAAYGSTQPSNRYPPPSWNPPRN